MISSNDQQDFALAFLSILFEGAPFILLGTLVSGFIDIYLPSGMMDRFLPRGKKRAVLVAGLMGAVFPVCECAVVPVIRRLVNKGLPVSCALAYMLAAPIVNPITALSTWKAFQGQNATMMTCSRVLLGFMIAAGAGLVVSRLGTASVLRPSVLAAMEAPVFRARRRAPAGTADAAVPPAPADDTRLVAAFRSALKDFIDVGVYFTIGVAITALFNTGIAPGAKWLDSLAANEAAAPAVLMVLAFVLSLCSTSDAFIAATLAKFSWGAKLAFLTFGPMLDIKLLFLYQTVLRKRFILLLGLGLFASVYGITVFWQHLILQAK